MLDEGGVYSPLSVSLIIPTKFEEEPEIEREALRRTLSECSELVDVGYLDEIVVMDATKDKNGKSDFRVLQRVVEVAYEELGLFKEQVNLLNKYRSQNERAKRGFIDFFIKVVHQFDDNILKALAKFGLFGFTRSLRVPSGKGAALWLSVPVTAGDILCFVDSDILNFKKEFVTALCHPIVYSWNLREAAIKFVKAYYSRLTKTPSLSPEEAILGGRVCRLFTTPFIDSITECLGLYTPLKTIKYPLAGEFALSRDTIQKLSFPSEYSVEIHLLFQLLDLIGSTTIAQVDLEIFHHIGKEFSELEDITRQVGNCILERLVDKRGKALTEQEIEEILLTYQEEATKKIEKSEELISDLKETAELEGLKEIIYSKEEEEKRFQALLKRSEDILSQEVSSDNIMLPSWRQIKEKTQDYFIIREVLRKRSNQSTWSRLKECSLVS
ncbi:hypothetical protein GWN63_00850 [Candidatus Bathyarchaeota archaeon]|nr:hypothetical protein [Candidatus Bathyarchaeota archaeon]NIU80785.1 hypothetical protein [Candidatus Bathyarchaeota archaeon]NIV67410.1 hypothetical protein [Candidatus Bathyarchaeota archaeon]NIW34056.1 hypothetical protein [Candidatus Bathyarchaeota archaeon]